MDFSILSVRTRLMDSNTTGSIGVRGFLQNVTRCPQKVNTYKNPFPIEYRALKFGF